MSEDVAKTTESAVVKITEAVTSPPGKTYILCTECDALVDVVEAPENDDLVREIVRRDVANRKKETYKCPNGHSGKLRAV